MTQEETLTIVKTGANVFLTGEPGAGKTHTVNQYVAWLRERGIEPAITASTGIAATHIGGMTIHAWSGIGIRRDLTEWDIEALLEREPLVKRVRSTQVLIIDEVSMLDAHILDLVDQALRALRNSVRPFGGMQVLFVGDFFQLPPVSREMEMQFAFDAQSWARANPLVCYLSEQHRQEDGAFLELLSALRAGTLTSSHRELLHSRKNAKAAAESATRLYPHNANVDRINDEQLSLLRGTPKTFAMQTQGATALVEALKRGCLSPELLQVKEGAAVMFTRNNFEAGYVNGSLGTVVGFGANSYPLVRLRNGRVVPAEPTEWRIDDGARTLAKLVQVPLRLAWAMTVHKSQGLSLDAAVMDLSQAFEYGQGYVALSRVRTLEGLFLLGFNEQALQVHPQVAMEDLQLRELSRKAREAFALMPKEELEILQKQFIKASGGYEPKDKPAPVEGKLEIIRKKFPNAYRSWSDEDDARLTQAFQNGAKQAALVKEFGRQRGAIHSRLVKLGLVEPDKM